MTEKMPEPPGRFMPDWRAQAMKVAETDGYVWGECYDALLAHHRAEVERVTRNLEASRRMLDQQMRAADEQCERADAAEQRLERAEAELKRYENSTSTVDARSQVSGPVDPECISHGNWRQIVGEYRHLFDRKYVEDSTGHVYTFYGLVHGSDDYYYGMYSKEHGPRLLSCVGSIEGFGFELVHDTPRCGFDRNGSHNAGEYICACESEEVTHDGSVGLSAETASSPNEQDSSALKEKS